MVKKVFLHNFVKGAIKPLGKILRIKRTDKKYFDPKNDVFGQKMGL